MLCRTKLATLTCDFQARRGPFLRDQGLHGGDVHTTTLRDNVPVGKLHILATSQLLTRLIPRYPSASYAGSHTGLHSKRP